MTTTSPAAVPAPNPWAAVAQSAVLLTLSGFGITDGALPTLVRAAFLPAVALVLAVLALAHHWTVRGAQQALAAAASTAQAAVTVPGIPQGVRVSADNFAAAVATVGAYVESQRQGVPVSGPAAPVDTGRHAALSPDATPTAVLPAVDPILAGLPAVEDDTQVIPLIPSVPSSPAAYQPSATSGVLRP